MALLNNDTPSAPPAPGIKSITGVGNQNQGIAGALANQPTAPSVQQQQTEQRATTSSQVEKSAGSVTPSPYKTANTPKTPTVPKPTTTAPKPSPKFQETPDPRDSIYWQNVQAIEATLGPGGTEMISLLAEEQQAQRAFDTDIERQKEYNRRRARDLAESRLGTGSIYSGMARRAQRENLQDFAADIGNRYAAFSDANFNRNIRRQDVGNRYRAGLRQEEAAGAARAYENMMQQANESSGDRTYTPPDPKVALRRQIQGTTKRIKDLREKLDGAKSDKQRTRIEKKLDRLKKRRSTLQGKVSGQK